MPFDPGARYVSAALVEDGYSVSADDIQWHCRSSQEAYNQDTTWFGAGAGISFFASLAAYGAIGSIALPVAAPVLAMVGCAVAAWQTSEKSTARESEGRLYRKHPQLVGQINQLIGSGADPEALSMGISNCIAGANRDGMRNLPALTMAPAASETWDGDRNAFNDPIAPETPSAPTTAPLAGKTMSGDRAAINAVVGAACSAQWIVGPSQSGKSALSGTIAHALREDGFAIWFLNLNYTEVSPVEEVAVRSIACDLDSDSPEVARPAIMGALAMLKDLKSAENTILVIDEFTMVLQSKNPLLNTLKDSISEALDRTRGSGPKRGQGILAIGTPYDPKSLSKELSQIAKAFVVLPLLCSETRSSRGVGYPSTADVLATAALSDLSMDLITTDDTRVLGVRGAYHPISHLNTYAERVRPIAERVTPKAIAPTPTPAKTPPKATAIGVTSAPPLARPSRGQPSRVAVAAMDDRARSEMDDDDYDF